MDITKLRNNTPGCKHVIHFNNAGASLMSQSTLDAHINYLQEEAKYGGYETAERNHNELECFYSEVAKLINAKPEEIAFTESATVAWQRIFFSIPFQKGDVIITCNSEYASNYISFLLAKDKFGVEIKNIPSLANGDIDLDALEKSIDNRTRLVAITHTPTNGGMVNAAEKIGKIAHRHNVFYLLDACQSAGQYPLDVSKIKCDFLSATGRKYLRGPRGTGFLYVNKKHIDKLTPQNLDLHGATWTSPDEYESLKSARKFETWESSLAAKYAFVTSLRELNHLNISTIWPRVSSLADYFRMNLQKLSNIEIYDIGEIKCGIVTFNSSKVSINTLKSQLDKNNINTSIAVASGTLLDATNRNLDKLIRASVHYYNTEEEVDKFIQVIEEVT